MATPYTVTYFRAIDVSGSSTPVTFVDISSWHTVQIGVPTADMNTIFRWSRAAGSHAATADTVDYWRFTAMLIRSFFNFDDTMTPLVDVSDGIGDEYYHQFQGGLSFTTPPTAATTETPAAPALNSSQIFPNTFNTLLLRWATHELYGTSRPAAGTVIGLAKAYELLTNVQAAHAIAKSFWGNTAQVQQMLTALTTNAQERYFDLNNFNDISAGYVGLVDTEAAAAASSGDWNWMTGDVLDIPLLISMPVFNGGASPMASARFRLQLVLNDTVQSWKTPYAIGSSPSVATVTTTVPEHGVIDTAVGTAQTIFTVADISTNAGAWDIVTDISNHLYVYNEARALRDYFAWVAGGAIPSAPVTTAPINVHDASGIMWAEYSALLSACSTTAQYLPITITEQDVSDGTYLQPITDASANMLSLDAAATRYTELSAYVGGVTPAPGSVSDVSNAAYQCDVSAAIFQAEADGYDTLYNSVFNAKTIAIEHAALRWWALSAYTKDISAGWTDISAGGEFLTPGSDSGVYVNYPLYEVSGNEVLPTIDVSPYLKDKRLTEYTAVVNDLAATQALLVLAQLSSNTEYIAELQTDISGLLYKRNDASGAYWNAVSAYATLADTELVELDASGRYYDPATRTIYDDPSGDRILLATPIRDASGYILDKLVFDLTDASGYYMVDPSGATIGGLYPVADYNPAEENTAIQKTLLFYTDYGPTVHHTPDDIPRLSIEEEYYTFKQPAQDEANRLTADAGDLRTILQPLFTAWPIVDASGNTIPLPTEKYADASAAYWDAVTNYGGVYTYLVADASGLFADFLASRDEYTVTDVSLGIYETDVSGWMHTNSDNTYVHGDAAPITAYMESVNEPFYRLDGNNFYNDWNAEPYDGAALGTRLQTLYRDPLDTFDAALATFQAKAPSGGQLSELAHTPILNAYMGETPTP